MGDGVSVIELITTNLTREFKATGYDDGWSINYITIISGPISGSLSNLG